MNTQPRQGRQNPFAHERQRAIAAPSLDTASEHEADNPQSLKAAKESVAADPESRCLEAVTMQQQSHAEPRREGLLTSVATSATGNQTVTGPPAFQRFILRVSA
jgi:hypothetical protein